MSVGMNSKKYKKKIIDDVSLGPKGEWFARWTDGSIKIGGMSDALSSKWKELISQGHSIKQVLFGPGDTYFIRYT